jgi:hypothetical protein
MAKVEVTPHLHAFFPVLRHGAVDVEATSVAEVVRAMAATAPGFAIGSHYGMRFA